MIVRGGQRVLVQGITGRQGTFWSGRMQEYGTRIVAGVNPKKAGAEHCGVPVHGSAREAMREVGFDVSVLFIPPLGVKAAALDAIEAGCPRLVVLTEHVPVQDVMEVLAAARSNGAAVAGPNTAGLVTPGECFVGFMPAFERDVFRPGSVGVVSRSGRPGHADLPEPRAGRLRGIRLRRDRRRPDPRDDHARRGAGPSTPTSAPRRWSWSARSAGRWRRTRRSTCATCASRWSPSSPAARRRRGRRWGMRGRSSWGTRAPTHRSARPWKRPGSRCWTPRRTWDARSVPLSGSRIRP